MTGGTTQGHCLDDTFDENAFAKIYCKVKGINAVFCEATIDYGSYIEVKYREANSNVRTDRVGMIDGLNLVSSYALSLDERLKRVERAHVFD